MIPEHRQAIHGRTWDREWQPCAVEHHQRRSRLLQRIGSWALGAVIGIGFASLVWLHLGA